MLNPQPQTDDKEDNKQPVKYTGVLYYCKFKIRIHQTNTITKRFLNHSILKNDENFVREKQNKNVCHPTLAQWQNPVNIIINVGNTLFFVSSLI